MPTATAQLELAPTRVAASAATVTAPQVPVPSIWSVLWTWITFVGRTDGVGMRSVGTCAKENGGKCGDCDCAAGTCAKE